MAAQFKLPELGENIEGGDVVSVLVSEGDTISEDQEVIEIETDKATLEVPCNIQGKVSKVHVKQGDHISVGDPVITLDGEAEGEPEKRKKDEQAESGDEDPSEAEAEAKDGSKTKRAEESEPSDQADESDRTSTEEDTDDDEDQEPEKAEQSDDEKQESRKQQKRRKRGKKKRHDVEDDERERAAEPKGESDDADEAEDAKEPGETEDGEGAEGAEDAAKADESSSSRPDAIPAAPSTRKLAREMGVDLEELAQAHGDERLTTDHVKAFVRDRLTGADAAASGPTGRTTKPPPLPDFEKWGPIDRVPRSTLERSAAERLTAAWAAPHVTHYDDADVGRLEAMRAHWAEVAGPDEPKLTLTAFLIKAAVRALRMFPKLNASLDTESNDLIIKHYYHIGVAVHTDRGLIVPVLRDCDKRSLATIAAELQELAERTRNRKIQLDELRGATFTITNVGGIGGTSFAPILSYPEVAILGAARARNQPMLLDGELTNRLTLPLCLSFDHRAINGADAAYFTREVIRFLENPDVFLMKG